MIPYIFSKELFSKHMFCILAKKGLKIYSAIVKKGYLNFTEYDFIKIQSELKMIFYISSNATIWSNFIRFLIQ